jgi:hypothetical protein
VIVQVVVALVILGVLAGRRLTERLRAQHSAARPEAA